MRIQLLGSPALLAGERRLEHPSRKAMALLAYLAMRADEHISRSHLAALLWADSGEEQARANLRQTLSQLRKLFQDSGHDPLLAPLDKIVLQSAGVEIDARQLTGSPEALAELPDFLEGFTVEAPEFESWAAAQRRTIQSRIAARLVDQARASLCKGDAGAAVSYLSHALKRDPLQESLHRELMEVLALQGRGDEALAQYDTCRKLLAQELQVEPDALTRKLASDIRAQRRSPARNAFSRYPGRSPALCFIGNRDAGALELAAPLRHDDAQAALWQALHLKRSDPGSRVAIAVVQDTGNSECDSRPAAALLRAAEPGEIAVAAEVYEQFRHWSPFAFEARKTGQGEPSSYRLLGEIERHRLQVTPILQRPDARPSSGLSLCVLPLQDWSPDAGEFGLGDLLAEEITHRLSRYRNLTVSAPSAGQSLRRLGDAPELARTALGVKYLVDGSVLRDGDRLQIRLTVEDVETSRLVLSHRFDGAFSSLLKQQSEVIDQIATAVFRKAEQAEVVKAERALTRDMGAYEWFLRGLAAHRRAGISPDNARQAFSHFTEAIRIDPDFARALAWRICSVSWYDPAYLVEPGMREIQHALSIDEEDAEVHRIAGALNLYSGNYSAGIHHIERAVELNPSDAYLLASSAVYWAYGGEPEKGLRHIERALLLDPFLPTWCVEDHGVVLYSMGRHQEAIESLRKIPVPRPRALAFLAAAQIAAGQKQESARSIAALRAVAPSYSVDELLRVTYYQAEAAKQELRAHLNEAGLP
jgi:DNA-binding SARP family transcriptional activator/TolB-like protein